MSLHTFTRQIELNELFLATDWTSFDALASAEATVEITYEYEPGQEAIIAADPNNSQEGFPDQLNVLSVKLINAVTCEGEYSSATIKAGTDLYDMLNPGQIRELEDEIVAPDGLEVDYEPDASDFAEFWEAA